MCVIRRLLQQSSNMYLIQKITYSQLKLLTFLLLRLIKNEAAKLIATSVFMIYIATSDDSFGTSDDPFGNRCLKNIERTSSNLLGLRFATFCPKRALEIHRI